MAEQCFGNLHRPGKSRRVQWGEVMLIPVIDPVPVQ